MGATGSPAWITASSARACCIVTPGFSRPITLRMMEAVWYCSSAASSLPSGVIACTWSGPGNAKLAGNTPTTTNCLPSSRMGRPTM